MQTFPTLLVIDNLETVPTPSILDFLKQIPANSKVTREIIQLLESEKNQIITLIGNGGIGKTATAVNCLYELLDRNSTKYEAILWVTLKTRTLAKGEFINIALVSLAKDIPSIDWIELNKTKVKLETNPQKLIVETHFSPDIDQSEIYNNLPAPEFDETGYIGRKKDNHNDDLLNELDMGDLVSLINGHKADFSINSDEAKFIDDTFKKIIPIRNRVMHTRPIQFSDNGILQEIIEKMVNIMDTKFNLNNRILMFAICTSIEFDLRKFLSKNPSNISIPDVMFRKGVERNPKLKSTIKRKR
ncbi:hypothetical protein GQS40_01790|uniref:NB-ARC domain-containing protein n=1 Tax=Leuconostoc lactis TaxID=1246 RepID=A0A6L7A8Z8_LEULA|nr:hypothetical protein [Leuconostoc lactis]